VKNITINIERLHMGKGEKIDKFEYKTDKVMFNTDADVVTILNAEGINGWAAVHFYHVPGMNVAPTVCKIIFMRKVVE
jgi:hypothetical protein